MHIVVPFQHLQRTNWYSLDMSGNVARDARKQQTLARLQKDVAAQVDKEKTQKVKQEKAYEARLEAEKGNPRCEEW